MACLQNWSGSTVTPGPLQIILQKNHSQEAKGKKSASSSPWTHAVTSCHHSVKVLANPNMWPHLHGWKTKKELLTKIWFHLIRVWKINAAPLLPPTRIFIQQQWCVKEVIVLVTDFKPLLENFHWQIRFIRNSFLCIYLTTTFHQYDQYVKAILLAQMQSSSTEGIFWTCAKKGQFY